MRMSNLAIVCALIASAPAAVQAQPAQQSWAVVDKALGRQGTTQPDGVRRYGFPRSDLAVQLDGVAIKPALALGSWLAFERMGRSAMVMGDLVLTPDEVGPVMSRLLNGGVQITALHNHLLRSAPTTMYMHVEGRGDPAALAETLRSALALSRTPLQQPAARSPSVVDLDTAALDRALGRQGKSNGGVYQFTAPRRERIIADGMVVPASMGTGTAINFQPVGGGKAAVTGDFVMTAKEVNPVMRSLQSNGVEITALHSHMIGEQPKLYFMHFWAMADANKLATAMRSALDLTNVRR